MKNVTGRVWIRYEAMGRREGTIRKRRNVRGKEER